MNDYSYNIDFVFINDESESQYRFLWKHNICTALQIPLYYKIQISTITTKAIINGKLACKEPLPGLAIGSLTIAPTFIDIHV